MLQFIYVEILLHILLQIFLLLASTRCEWLIRIIEVLVIFQDNVSLRFERDQKLQVKFNIGDCTEY